MAYDGMMADMEKELNHSKERADTLEREVIGLDYGILVFLLYDNIWNVHFCCLNCR
jgi:hypothetical protein